MRDNMLLTNLYVIGACVGALATVYLMQLSWRSEADMMDPPWLRNARRLSLAWLALSLLYGADYVARSIAAPWLPNVLLVWCVLASVALRIVAVNLRAPAVHRMVAMGLLKVK